MRKLEEKRQKFLRIGEARINRAIDSIERIGNLSNGRLYAWEEKDIKKMTKALRDTISQVETRFTMTKDKVNKKFNF